MTAGPGEKFDYLLKGMKAKGSRVKSLESRESSLESTVQTEESGVQNPEPIIQATEADSREESPESRINNLESRVESLDYRVLEEAIEEATKKPKLGVYSPLAAAILRYKAIKTPRYSMGSELREVIEQALRETYPELYEEVQRRMSQN